MADGAVNEAVEEQKFDYDLFVLGGGSGGLACAKEAADLNQKVGLCDFVVPSPAGTTWGLGGTCVCVGCIPKKLIHTAAIHGEHIADAEHYGWSNGEKKHDWTKLVEVVQDHIGSLNWGYRVSLQDHHVQYLNSLAKFIGPHTVELVDKKKQVKRVTAKHFVVAVGGRPRYPDIPGIEHVISSDDIFSHFDPPGKTLVVGASYVALECAGFLTGLGFDTTVIVRSILLRGFDQEIAEMIGTYMSEHGTKFVRPAEPHKIEKLDSGKLRVYWKNNMDAEVSNEFDTVLYAVGRDPQTAQLGLETVGVKTNPANGKIITQNEQTSSPYVFAIGDVIDGYPELTPVAIKAGRLLAHRLYENSPHQMDYVNIPTTVFTPLEYGAIGLSEEEAEKRFGKDNIEVYHSFFQPLEFTVAHRPENKCFTKVVTNKLQNERIVGMHFLGPNAGEVTQGFATGMRLGMTKHDLDMTVGIHPTVAEEFIGMNITKRSGKSPLKTGC